MPWPALISLAALCAGAQAGLADSLIEVPSSQPITLIETIWNIPGPDGLTTRFRFLAPEISRSGGRIGFDEAEIDMAYLCNTYALPRVLTLTGPKPEQIIISLSDQIVPFGETAPEITQFFDGFAITAAGCLWEPF